MNKETKPKWAMKMFCIVSEEAFEIMQNEPGKLAAQSGHAFTDAFINSLEKFKADADAYKNLPGRPKITLIAPENTLIALNKNYKDVCAVALIRDEAHTVFSVPTITCLGIGPIKVELIKDDISNLKTLRKKKIF